MTILQIIGQEILIEINGYRRGEAASVGTILPSGSDLYNDTWRLDHQGQPINTRCGVFKLLCAVETDECMLSTEQFTYKSLRLRKLMARAID